MQLASLCDDAVYSPWCDPFNQEAPMQQYQDKSDDAHETDSWTRIVLAAHGVILLVIVALVANYPVVSEWVSAAAQAEFVNPDLTSVGSTQMARPAEQMRIVRSN
jgi:hypothetical protein